VRIFGREPTLWLQFIAGVLGVGVAVGLPGLSVDQAAAIIAVVTAVFAVVNAVMVRPVAPAAFTGLVASGAVLLAAYGFTVSQPTLAAVQTAVLAVLALLTRAQVTPVGRHQATP
jgi:hypothetical protein